MRLHELTPEQLEEWRKARMAAGREKYGDAHLQRYVLVDVMEELLDALNIMDLLEERVDANDLLRENQIITRITIASVRDYLNEAIWFAQLADEDLPDELCSDEQGGDRIWWSDQVE